MKKLAQEEVGKNKNRKQKKSSGFNSVKEQKPLDYAVYGVYNEKWTRDFSLIIYGACDEDWTRDLSLTKGVLYHWATQAKIKFKQKHCIFTNKAI